MYKRKYAKYIAVFMTLALISAQPLTDVYAAETGAYTAADTNAEGESGDIEDLS